MEKVVDHLVTRLEALFKKNDKILILTFLSNLIICGSLFGKGLLVLSKTSAPFLLAFSQMIVVGLSFSLLKTIPDTALLKRVLHISSTVYPLLFWWADGKNDTSFVWSFATPFLLTLEGVSLENIFAIQIGIQTTYWVLGGDSFLLFLFFFFISFSWRTSSKVAVFAETPTPRSELLKSRDAKSTPVEPMPFHSPAESIINVMRKFQKTKEFSIFKNDIDFVIDVIASGKNLYQPDMEVVSRDLDRMTRMFLASHHGESTLSKYKSLPRMKEMMERKKTSTNFNADLKKSLSDARSNSFHDRPLEVEMMLSHLLNWNFDVFLLNEKSHQRPLYFAGEALFRAHDLLEKFSIPEETLHNFLVTVENLYKKDNPYHNNIHAADVTLTFNYIITELGPKKYLSDLDIFAGIVAAMIHDIDHPGFNNAFEVRTQSRKALLHNDISVLENHHLATAFDIIQTSSTNIFCNLSKETYTSLRATVIGMVLATDFSRHLDILGQFKSRRAAGPLTDSLDDRLLILKLALKCADISHTSKSPDLHLNWTNRVQEEFFHQGDAEKEKGLPISPFMDRNNTDIPKSQCGFIGFLVKPLYQAFVEEFPAAQMCLDQLEFNLSKWEEKKRLNEAIQK